MPTLLRYTYTCDSGDVIADDWRELSQGDPTTCRNDSSHKIVGFPIVAETIDPEEITVKEEQTISGNSIYAFDTIAFSIPAKSTAMGECSWTDDIGVLSFTYVTKPEHEGDTFTGYIGENTEICAIQTEVKAGEKTIPIPLTGNGQSMFMNFLCKGCKLKITDGKNTDDLGFITAADKSSFTLSVENATTRTFDAGSKLLLTRILGGRLGPIEIGPAWSYTIGKDKIGSSYLPANTKIKIEYNNKSDVEKRFVVIVRYLY